ncbi:MAG: glycogen synthase [Armatimonadetes bacterium]|nr:glycogen synthase [Armatimonadota bacterium]
MKILFVSAEMAPFAKVGGLADVAASLPKALKAIGHEVRVFMPGYGLLLEDPSLRAKPVIDQFIVRVNAARFVKGTLYRSQSGGTEVWSVDGEVNFRRARSSEHVYTFSRDDYLYFSQAALEACQETGWIPDVVHCHDWHTGFIPAILRELKSGIWDNVPSVFTIHNLAYQGEFGFDTLDACGLPHSLYRPEMVEAYGSVNFLKTGAAFADQVNTVSPNYAHEIQTPEFGCRLDGHMRYLHSQGRLHGILNGIDAEVWNPATDPALPANYSAEDLQGKSACRNHLVKLGGLTKASEGPILGMVTRLSNQKGFDLLLEAADRLFATGACLVVQGLGDPWASSQLRRLEAKYPGQVKFFELFDADLAQQVYAGCDAFLMPSAFEPCGLGQMFAMRYGTVPVVRHTGGLADTVFDGHTGFTFSEQSGAALADAVERCAATFRKADRWRELVYAGMASDFSWSKSAQAYVQLYRLAVADRKFALSHA